MNPHVYAYLLLALPLLSAALIALFLRRAGKVAAGVSVSAALLVLLVAGHLVFRVENFAYQTEWFAIGPAAFPFGFLVDDLAKLMLLVVALVGFLVHVFSLGYMKDDPDKGRFFGGLSLFMFSMIGIVLAQSLVTLFVFWELVGFSSYMLIGFYLFKPSASAAAKKAFAVNRVGDFGFLLGIVLAFWHYGGVGLGELRETAAASPALLEAGMATGIGLLLFCGAVGKSGQLPLHVWLPDAMEGPTPVSALIHAATMVAAGVYMLCRVGFLMTADALEVVAWIGVATALTAGLTALGQRDIKRILAYSTVSQLGYMVAAFGFGSLAALGAGAAPAQALVTGGAAAAMFHLTTHAFFKALLFLGAGSAIHAARHEQDIFRLGGLRRSMPWTAATFGLGALALAGAPFLAGFYSKDAILAVALEASPSAFWLLVAGALLTALYMTRLWLIAFCGEPKSEAASAARENGPVFVVPLVLLAAGSVFAGYQGLYSGVFDGVLSAVPHPEAAAHTLVVAASVIAILVGAAAAWAIYRPGAREDRLEGAAKPLHAVLANRLYFDHAYDFYVAKIQQPVASALYLLEQIALSGLIIRGVAGVAGLIGLGLKALHVGNLHAYLYWFIGGLALYWALAM